MIPPLPVEEEFEEPASEVVLDPFFLGVLSDSSSRSGLPFAASDTFDGLAVGTLATFPVQRVRNVQGETGIVSETIDIMVEVISAATETEAAVLRLSLDGETFDISPRENTPMLQAEDGTSYEFYAFAENDYSTLLAVYADAEFPAQILGGLNTEGALLLGLESLPSTIASRTGQASYAGEFSGGGGSRDADGNLIRLGLENQGTIVLSVDFSDQSLSGELSGELAGFIDFEGTMSVTEITGNGYVGDLQTTCVDGFTCVSESKISGTFFGPTAQETAGLIDFQVGITEESTGDTYHYIGAGGYGAVEGATLPETEEDLGFPTLQPPPPSL